MEWSWAISLDDKDWSKYNGNEISRPFQNQRFRDEEA